MTEEQTNAIIAWFRQRGHTVHAEQELCYDAPARIAAFMDALHWAGADIEDIGGRFLVHDDPTGLLQAEVDKRYTGIYNWWLTEDQKAEKGPA